MASRKPRRKQGSKIAQETAAQKAARDEAAKNAQLEVSLGRFYHGQPLQTFDVLLGDGSTLTLEAHDASVGTPQPHLSFTRIEGRDITIEDPETGEEELVKDHPVQFYSGGCPAGGWISFVDKSVGSITKNPSGKPKVDKENG